MDVDEKKRHQRYYKNKNLLKDWVKSFKDRREKFLEEVEQAKELRGKVFYQRVKVGHNGRIYFPEGLSYQGSDFARAVIEFAEGMPLTEEGWQMLHLHAVNMHGGKADIGDRIAAGGKVTHDMAMIAMNPVDDFEVWSGADKPYGFLRACLELADAWAIQLAAEVEMDFEGSTAGFEKYLDDGQQKLLEGLTQRIERTTKGKIVDGRIEFYSHLPVELDQANSAFAHIGLLMGDEELQKKAGMGQEWSDIYTDIANEKGVLDKQGLKEAEKRKIIKKVSVPWSYGAGKQTCGDAIVKIVDECLTSALLGQTE
jgi:hypothetical protein